MYTTSTRWIRSWAVAGRPRIRQAGLERPTESSAAGQMRISLAKLLCKAKPAAAGTSHHHLDLESRNWCENYLTTSTHTFSSPTTATSLDVTVNKTIEIWNKRLHTYQRQLRKILERRRRSGAPS